MCGGKTLLASWALLLLCSVVHGQLEALRQVGDAREQYVRAFRLVWAVEETRIVSSSPVERTQIEQEAEFLQHELKARGAKDVSGVKQQLLREVDIVIDVERGGAPLRVVKRNADCEGQVEVIRYVQSGGYWLPTTVKSIFRTRRQNPGMTRQRTWQLRGVQTKRVFSLNLIASSPTVIHWGLRDLRAYGCDLTLPQTVALASDKEVFYNWEGRLPTVDEVREMLASRQRKQSPKGTFSAWYRVVPPVLLILIGAYWYWRARRAERRA